MRRRMLFGRPIVPAIIFVLATVLLIHLSGTRVHAHMPPHCGFWTSIEAGLSCE